MKRGTGLKANPEKTREWQQRSRKPIAKVAKRHSRAFWAKRAGECRVRDGKRCRRCFLESSTYSGMTLDAAHVIPLASRGTRNDASLDLNELCNLVTLCRGCHTEKESLGWTWTSIGVVPDAALALEYGYREGSLPAKAGREI